MKKKNVYCFILIVVFLMGILCIRLNLGDKNKNYKELEDSMESLVSQYLGQYINEYPESGSKTIKISDVINKGYVLNTNVKDDRCDGYVVVKKVSIAYEYDGYIKCNNYVTKGYK